MSYPGDLIALVDQRIRAARRKTRAMGQVVTRDTTGPGATVRHDGAATPTPALCLGNVFCRPGDWVTLDLYDTTWVVTGSFSQRGFGEASRGAFGPGSAATTTSSSYNDIVDLPSAQFTKFLDDTYVRYQFRAAGFSTGAASIFYGLRFTPISGAVGYTATDYPAGFVLINTNINIHFTDVAASRIPAMPAGLYTVQARWRRSAGSGTVSWDSNDYMAFELDERPKAADATL